MYVTDMDGAFEVRNRRKSNISDAPLPKEAYNADSGAHAHRRSHSGLLKEVFLVGWDRFRHAENVLGEHTHSAYEICYIVSGSVDWWSPDGVHELTPGQVYITHPGERHGGLDAMMHPCELYWLILKVPTRGAMAGVGSKYTEQLRAGLQKLKLRQFPGSKRIPDYFERLMEAHRIKGPTSALSARAALHELLGQVLEDYQLALQRRGTQAAPTPVQRAIERIEQWPEEDWIVEELAREADLSVSHFHQLFADATGFSPADYRIRCRVRKAKEVLRSADRSVTELAYELGFSSSQYFATVFKNLTGLSPREYRKRSVAMEQKR